MQEDSERKGAVFNVLSPILRDLLYIGVKHDELKRGNLLKH